MRPHSDHEGVDKTNIVTGDGQDFVRVYSEKTCGIPPEQVVGRFRASLTFLRRISVRIPRSTMALVFAMALSGPVAFAQDGGSVENATFTANIADGAPVDFRQQFTNSTPVVYFYGELLDLNGQTVTFLWSLEGKRMQETAVQVTSPRQPAWSKMNMQEQWTGNWNVAILDGKGRTIEQRNFAFNPPL